MEVVPSKPLACVTLGGVPVSVGKHGGPKVPGSKDFLGREPARKVASTSIIVACYNNAGCLRFANTTAKDPVNAAPVQPVSYDGIVPAIDPDLAPFVSV